MAHILPLCHFNTAAVWFFSFTVFFIVLTVNFSSAKHFYRYLKFGSLMTIITFLYMWTFQWLSTVPPTAASRAKTRGTHGDCGRTGETWTCTVLHPRDLRRSVGIDEHLLLPPEASNKSQARVDPAGVKLRWELIRKDGEGGRRARSTDLYPGSELSAALSATRV